MVGEQFGAIDLGDRIDGNVGCLVLETSMHVDRSINAPHGSSESLDSSEFVPL